MAYGDYTGKHRGHSGHVDTVSMLHDYAVCTNDDYGLVLHFNNKISEFMAAMNRMRLPQGLAISIAVMMRFFPTLSEEYRSIRDAMRMRGIAFGGGKVTKMIEYRLVPLLFSCISIGDELSAAAVTRGLGAPVKRTNVCEIGFHSKDYVVIAVTLVLSILYIYLSV